MKIVILGAGRIGTAMAIDLARDAQFQVFVGDNHAGNLAKFKSHREIGTIEADLSNSEQVKSLISNYDMVIDGLPGFLGFQTFRSVIEAGRPVVDIAFFPEDPFQLDNLAKNKGVSAIMDCGVAPGLSNLLIGYADHILDETKSVAIYVGGLPVIREWPYEYKAPFSPIDVIEEYTRPARLVENGQVVTRPALSGVERVAFPGIGTLEAFNTDGLRTLIKTIDAPNMKEKTLRYPGHIQLMEIFRETGFFEQEPVDLGGTLVRPLDVTSRLLFPKWEFRENEEDLTIMKVIVEGKKDGKRVRYIYDLFDRYDPTTHTTSMARTTGYMATTAVRMLVAGLFKRKGVSPPELIGQSPECVKFIRNGLNERGVVWREEITELE